MTRRRRGDRGAIAVEMLAAMAVLMMTAMFTFQIVRGVSRTTIRVQNTDRATSFGYDMLERARAFGCGTEVFSESQLPQRLTNCSPSGGDLGSAVFTLKDEQNRVYEATVRSRWGRSDLTSNAACAHMRTPAPGTTVASPNTLNRSVTVKYPLGQVYGTVEFNVVESVPPDAIEFNSGVRGAIVISGAAPLTGSASLSNGIQQIRRYADAAGCIWFPFVPEGSRPVSVNGGGTFNVPVQPNVTTCRTSGNLPC